MSLGRRVNLPPSVDGFAAPAYHAPALEARRGGLVVLHALWGVTPHIVALCDTFASEGWECLAPSLLEREDPGFPERDVEPDRRNARLAAAAASGFGDAMVSDISAAIAALAPPVCAIGFCFGGTAAFVAAHRCEGLSAVASFYGGDILARRHMAPRTGLALHFGRGDPLVPPADVEAISEARPEATLWLYDAGHAFVAPDAGQPDAARLGLLRARQQFHRAVSAGRLEGS